MPTYTVTAHHTCMRCGATATAPVGADLRTDGHFHPRATAHAPKWRDVTIPHPSGPVVRGELCPACVAAVAAFILPSKEP